MSDDAKARGIYRFQFFRMGKFEEVIVDDYLPEKTANPHNHEWWVPLCEKAYAKFSGSYDNLHLGNPSWALTDLTGGISLGTDALKNDLKSTGLSAETLYSFLYKTQHQTLMCTGNYGGTSQGLVQNHAYTLLRIEQLDVSQKAIRLVKFRNPHGTAGIEWNGDWKDGDSKWGSISDADKQRIGYSNTRDGEFWMTFDDWIDQFESFDICLLPKP